MAAAPGAIRPSSTAAPGSPRRSTGPASHDPELNELERAFLDASTEASEREAERQRRAVRRLRTLLAGVGVLLAAAVVAGVIALSERQGARSAATVAAAQRLGAQAVTENLDQALRLATAGVALDDSVATRSSLLSTLLRNPAAIRVLTPTGEELPAFALSPDGETLAASDADGTVTLFDTDTYEVVGEHQAPATAYVIAFDPQGDSLAVAEDSLATGGTLEILDAATGRVRSSTSLAAGQGFAPLGIVIYAPDGRSLFVPYTRGGSLFLRRYDARRGTPLGEPVRVGVVDQPLGVTPDGRLLVAADRGVKALDAETLRVIRRYPFRGGPDAVSPDGRTLAIEPPDGGLGLLDLASGRVRTLTGPGAGTPQAFSPDGRTLSTAEDDGSVILWDVEQGVPTETLEGHAGVTETHAFSPDGRTLYTAGNDGRVIVWDVAGDRRLGRPFPRGLGGWEGTPVRRLRSRSAPTDAPWPSRGSTAGWS